MNDQTQGIDNDFQRITIQNEERFKQSLMNYQNTYEYQQETRQISLHEEYRTISVHIAREDYPNIHDHITIDYLYSAAQKYWNIFLNLVREKLELDFVDSIYEKHTLTPIHTILRLQPGGSYLVRQREESSILELIRTGVRPGKIVWPITKDINSSKQRLHELAQNQLPMDTRVDRLIHKPQIRVRQRGITTLLLKTQFPEEILQIINELVRVKNPSTAAAVLSAENQLIAEEIKNEIEADNLKKLDPEIDLPAIYRLSLECLNRHAVKGLMEEVGDDRIVTYVLEVLSEYKENVDITVIGMKLLNDIVKVLTRHVAQVFQVVMDAFQFYAPPPVPGYPRVIKRLLPSPEEVAKKQQEEEERMLREQKLKEEQDLLELESKIVAREREVSKAARENITTKVLVPKEKTVTLTKKQMKIQKQMRERKERAALGDQAHGVVDNTSASLQTQTQGEQEEHEEEGRGLRLREKRSGRLPVAQVVNVSRHKHSSSTTSASASAAFQLHLSHGADASSSTLPPLPVSSWKGPKISRRPLKSLAEPAPKKKSVWASFLSTTMSFDLGGATGGEGSGGGDLLEDTSSLPLVSGLKFIGITAGHGSGNQRSQVAFLQCVMTIFQYTSCHYANREIAYELFLHEELCDVGLLCVHLPKVMSYILWSLDKIMMDRIEEAENRV
jgi:hypothetical protein